MNHGYLTKTTYKLSFGIILNLVKFDQTWKFTIAQSQVDRGQI